MDVQIEGLSEYERLLSDKTPKALTALLRKGINKATLAIKRDAVRNLSQRMPSAKTSKGCNKYIKTPLTKGIRKTKVFHDSDDGMYGFASAWAGRRGDYRLHFFEGGTKIRQTKKGKNRGRVQGVYYMRDAIKANEHKIDKIISDTIQRELDKELNS